MNMSLPSPPGWGRGFMPVDRPVVRAGATHDRELATTVAGMRSLAELVRWTAAVMDVYKTGVFTTGVFTAPAAPGKRASGQRPGREDRH